MKIKFGDALSKSLLTLYTVVGEISSYFDDISRISGFSELSEKIILIKSKFSPVDFSILALVQCQESKLICPVMMQIY